MEGPSLNIKPFSLVSAQAQRIIRLFAVGLLLGMIVLKDAIRSESLAGDADGGTSNLSDADLVEGVRLEFLTAADYDRRLNDYAGECAEALWGRSYKVKQVFLSPQLKGERLCWMQELQAGDLDSVKMQFSPDPNDFRWVSTRGAPIEVKWEDKKYLLVSERGDDHRCIDFVSMVDTLMRRMPFGADSISRAQVLAATLFHLISDDSLKLELGALVCNARHLRQAVTEFEKAESTSDPLSSTEGERAKLGLVHKLWLPSLDSVNEPDSRSFSTPAIAWPSLSRSQNIQELQYSILYLTRKGFIWRLSRFSFSFVDLRLREVVEVNLSEWRSRAELKKFAEGLGQ